MHLLRSHGFRTWIPTALCSRSVEPHPPHLKVHARIKRSDVSKPRSEPSEWLDGRVYSGSNGTEPRASPGTMAHARNTCAAATSWHACKIGDHCLVGPNAHVVASTLEDEVFVATAAAIFHGTRLGR